ncbi:HNH endonuclease [Bacillus phage phiNIT1]|uniref:Putative HNH homing endonuclease n=1 Tax=Bacillus phage phiNIT1 TaxID=207656 RepID=S6ANT1_9CAUD|nr:HNH endonuclease [Bacillus phage phiNIT1]BAN59663.1 putative HNH homing endonuclease [Bacillus phage phiNIT1]
MKENWESLKGVVKHGDKYAVSTLGRVKNANTGRILKPYTTPLGYHQVSLCSNSQCKNYRVHRLVALVFIPNPDNKREVNHKDTNKQNNCISNLEWSTSSENHKHAYAHGLMKPPVKKRTKPVKKTKPKPKGRNRAELTEQDVIEIRKLAATGEYTHEKLSTMFGVHRRTISYIIQRKTWADVG